MKSNLGDYKRHLTQEFLKEIHKKQQELNVKINDYFQKRVKELDDADQQFSKIEEEENNIKRSYQTLNAESKKFFETQGF